MNHRPVGPGCVTYCPFPVLGFVLGVLLKGAVALSRPVGFQPLGDAFPAGVVLRSALADLLTA
jgi:hypothetical protein